MKEGESRRKQGKEKEEKGRGKGKGKREGKNDYGCIESTIIPLVELKIYNSY